MKSPPVQMRDSVARECVNAFIRGAAEPLAADISSQAPAAGE